MSLFSVFSEWDPWSSSPLIISFSDTKFLFSQVPADLQNEVLLSLLETDPDVVDHLLRRKASPYSWVSAFSWLAP